MPKIVGDGSNKPKYRGPEIWCSDRGKWVPLTLAELNKRYPNCAAENNAVMAEMMREAS